MSNVASNLLRLRKKAPLSVETLSALSGVSVTALRKIEAGKSAPTVTTLAALAGVLGCTVEDLVHGVPSSKPVAKLI